MTSKSIFAPSKEQGVENYLKWEECQSFLKYPVSLEEYLPTSPHQKTTCPAFVKEYGTQDFRRRLDHISYWDLNRQRDNYYPILERSKPVGLTKKKESKIRAQSSVPQEFLK